MCPDIGRKFEIELMSSQTNEAEAKALGLIPGQDVGSGLPRQNQDQKGALRKDSCHEDNITAKI